MNRRSNIGFDRRVDFEWLDAAAAQAATGASSDQIRAYLWSFLEGVVSGDTADGARRKTITVLNHIWGDVPGAAIQLKSRALFALPGCAHEERLAIHWAMTLGTYPLFGDVASAVGRLTALQGGFAIGHLERRLTADWGERSTLKRAAQRVVRSMVQWGALQDTSKKGEFEAPPKKLTIGPEVSLLIAEALLLDCEHGALPLDRLISHPAAFPFVLELSPAQLYGARQFEIYREGLDSELVTLRKSSTNTNSLA